MYNHKIVNTLTGEEIIEPLSATESAVIDKNAEEAAKLDKLEQIAKNKRLEAVAKLEALGLDSDDLKALGLG